MNAHTLRHVIATTEKLTGCAIEGAYVDKGYRGHDTENPRRLFVSGQKWGVFGVIKRELRCRSPIDAVIGHLKSDGHVDRLSQAQDAANAVLSAVGHNVRLVAAWLRTLLCLIQIALRQTFSVRLLFKSDC